MAQAMINNCPVCQKPTNEKHRPFCSARCANIDLGRWLGEKYAIPTDDAPMEIFKSPDDQVDY